MNNLKTFLVFTHLPFHREFMVNYPILDPNSVIEFDLKVKDPLSGKEYKVEGDFKITNYKLKDNNGLCQLLELSHV